MNGGSQQSQIDQLRSYANVLPTNQTIIEEGQPIPLEGSIVGLTFTTGQPVLLDYRMQKLGLERAGS
jgi:hypothetical protein